MKKGVRTPATPFWIRPCRLVSTMCNIRKGTDYKNILSNLSFVYMLHVNRIWHLTFTPTLPPPTIWHFSIIPSSVCARKAEFHVVFVLNVTVFVSQSLISSTVRLFSILFYQCWFLLFVLLFFTVFTVLIYKYSAKGIEILREKRTRW